MSAARVPTLLAGLLAAAALSACGGGGGGDGTLAFTDAPGAGEGPVQVGSEPTVVAWTVKSGGEERAEKVLVAEGPCDVPAAQECPEGGLAAEREVYRRLLAASDADQPGGITLPALKAGTVRRLTISLCDRDGGSCTVAGTRDFRHPAGS